MPPRRRPRRPSPSTSRPSDSYAYAAGGLYGAGDVGLYSSFWDAEDDLWAGELRLDGSVEAFGRRHLVLGGLEMNHQVSDFAYGYTALGTANIYQGNFPDAGIVPGGNNVTAASTTATVENKAIYGQVVLGLAERTRLLVGGRYDIADQESRDQLAAAVTGTKSDEAFTMRVGLSHDFTANVTAYGSYAQSFSPVTAVSRTGEILDPETGEGFELGLKTLWLGERLGTTLALFRQELDNRPINDPGNGPGQFFSISGGLQRTDGIELEVSGSPYPGLEVGGAAALLDSEFIDPLDPNFGLRPEGALDRQFSLYASYELQQGSLEGFGVGATLVSVSERVMLQGGENLFVQGYERLDLQATYRGIPGLDLALQVRNVLDARYVERVSNVPGFENHFGSPRALLVRAEVDF